MSYPASPRGEQFVARSVSVVVRIRDFVESLGALLSPKPALVPIPTARRERSRRR